MQQSFRFFLKPFRTCKGNHYKVEVGRCNYLLGTAQYSNYVTGTVKTLRKFCDAQGGLGNLPYSKVTKSSSRHFPTVRYSLEEHLKLHRRFIWTWRKSNWSGDYNLCHNPCMCVNGGRWKTSVGKWNDTTDGVVLRPLQFQCRCLTTTALRHHRKQEKKELPNKKANLADVVSIWKNITVAELSKVVRRSEGITDYSST